MFSCLLMLGALDGDAVEHLQFFEEEQSVETIRLFLGDGIS